MGNLKILYVSSEINPFLKSSEVADYVRKLPQSMQERGMEIRILVPRFGIINERKNRLHAVIFFRDPLGKHPHEPDVQMLLRLCDLYNVPLATNPATGHLLLKGIFSEKHTE